jgi:outer membrane protein OmpA-like peptidoglycan-associated protein
MDEGAELHDNPPHYLSLVTAYQSTAIRHGMSDRAYMKASTISHGVRVILSAAGLAVSWAEEPANPNSRPVKDESAKAGQDSRPVEDNSKASGKDSRPVQDEGDKANERAQERPADTSPVNDDSAKASPDAERLEDSREASGNDSRKVQDRNQKASPDARRTTDRSQKAGPEAAAVNDTTQDRANPDSRITSSLDREREAGPQAVEPEGPSAFESETAVREAVREAEAAVRLSKLQIAGPDEARAILNGILAEDGPVSRAEQARGDALSDEAASVAAEIPEEMRDEARIYLQDHLRGQVTADRKVPTFFGTSAEQRGSDQAAVSFEAERRFFLSGKRYLHFYSNTTIPAVLLAHASLGNVSLNTAVQAAKLLPTPEDRLAVLPGGYRSVDAWVISYPVSTEGMFSTDKISFRPASTQFADTLSHDMVVVLSEAIKNPAFVGQRFVIEAHTSAEGSFEENQILSQERAEAIARALIREGVPMEQVIPVGFGESEAQHPADAPAADRLKDRRVIVFRLADTSVDSESKAAE